MQIPLIAEQGKGYSSPLNAVSTINLYPVADPGGKQKVALYGTPGCEEWVNSVPVAQPDTDASKWDTAVSASGQATYTNSDRQMTSAGGPHTWVNARATVSRDEGLRYFEVYSSSYGSGNVVGVCTAGQIMSSDTSPSTANGGNCWGASGTNVRWSTIPGTGALPGGSGGSITRGVAINFASGKMWFSVDGVWVGDPVAGTGESFNTLIAGTLYPATWHAPASTTLLRLRTDELSYPPPTGYSAWATGSSGGITPQDGPIRGCVELNDVGYYVAGNAFLSVDTLGNYTQHGLIDEGTNPVNVETNGQQVAVCDGQSLWIYDITTEVFAQITDPDFPGAASFAVLDGYGLFNKPTTGQFYITGLLDFTTVDALDFATAESVPDDLVRVFANGGKAWLFGKRSIEPWVNTGDELFPFAPVGNVRIQRGIAGVNAVTECDGVPCFLGDNRIFYRLDGYTATPISKEDVEFNVGRMATVNDCIAMSYTQEGHLFCAFKFPTEGVTWVWDVGTGLWHQRKTGDASWRANCMMKLGNRQLLGDDSTPRLLEVRTDLYEDDGAEMVAEHVLPAVWDDNTKIAHSVLEVDFESGIGSVTGSDPSVVLDWSDDGGRTWSNFLTRKLGKIGNYLYRAIFTRLGSSEQRNYRIRISDPVKRVITGVGLNRQDKGR